MKSRCFSQCVFPVLVTIVVCLCEVRSASADLSRVPKILWKVKPYPTPTNAFAVAVPAVEFSLDGEQIITAGLDGSIKFLNRSDGSVTKTILAHTGAVHAVAISKDGLLLASGGADRMLNLWRVSDGTLLRSINAHTSAVYSVAFSPDASVVISGGGLDYQLKMWRTSDGQFMRAIQGTRGQSQDSFGGMRSVTFAPNGQYIAASGLEVWTLDGTRVGNFSWAEATTHVTFTPDSTRVFGTIPYGILGFIIADGSPFHPRSTTTYPPSAISPDGRSLVTASASQMMWADWPLKGFWFEQPNDGEIQSYDCADGECSLMLSSLAFDPRMQTVAAGTESGEVLLFELRIWISGIQRNGADLNIQWQGGSGAYQPQKKETNSWQDLGAPIFTNAATVHIDSSAALLRIRQADR